MIIAAAKSASRPALSPEMPLMLNPEVFGIGPATPQPSIDLGQRLLSQKSNYRHSRVRLRTDIPPILTYSFSGELGCKDYFATIVNEHIALLLSA